MKAEDYVSEWCDKTHKGGKELGDWTTKEVMQFANDYAQRKVKNLTIPRIIKSVCDHPFLNVISLGNKHNCTKCGKNI